MKLEPRHKMSKYKLPEPDWSGELRLYRKRKRLSRADVAFVMGVTPGAVAHWERGRTSLPSNLTWELHRDRLALTKINVRKGLEREYGK